MGEVDNFQFIYEHNLVFINIFMTCITYIACRYALEKSGYPLEALVLHIIQELKALISKGSYVYRLDAMVTIFSFIIALCLIFSEDAAAFLIPSGGHGADRVVAAYFTIMAMFIFTLISMCICDKKK